MTNNMPNGVTHTTKMKETKLVIYGGLALQGELCVSGSKNGVLPIMAACLLTNKTVNISNVPSLQDVNTMQAILTDMGVYCQVDGDLLSINTASLRSCQPNCNFITGMRASILLLGPLLTRYGGAKIALPGGCKIGVRPIDIHLTGLEAMGAKIMIEKGIIYAKAPSNGLSGTTITMPQTTVTGTENLMMAAVLAKGRTTLREAACEPEIVSLANFLNQLGAKIKGAGTTEIIIDGVSALSGTNYRIFPDRIEAATYLAAAMITGGSIKLTDIQPSLIAGILEIFNRAGAVLTCGDNWVALDMDGRRPKAVDIDTMPYPGFPTDMQPQMLAVNAIARGASRITEHIFENRFSHVKELVRMGANITINHRTAICVGVKQLKSAQVIANDLRGSAALVLAALATPGETIIHHVYHIDRGYAQLDQRLINLGAKLHRI